MRQLEQPFWMQSHQTWKTWIKKKVDTDMLANAADSMFTALMWNAGAKH